MEAWAVYGGLQVEQQGAGEEFALNSFRIDPTDVLHSTGFCHAFGTRLGQPVSPLGCLQDGAALLVIDVTGRVFSADHTGEYFLGSDINAALNTLIAGSAIARVNQDGTW